jgi:pre-mRNA-processing factor 40
MQRGGPPPQGRFPGRMQQGRGPGPGPGPPMRAPMGQRGMDRPPFGRGDMMGRGPMFGRGPQMRPQMDQRMGGRGPMDRRPMDRGPMDRPMDRGPPPMDRGLMDRGRGRGPPMPGHQPRMDRGPPGPPIHQNTNGYNNVPPPPPRGPLGNNAPFRMPPNYPGGPPPPIHLGFQGQRQQQQPPMGMAPPINHAPPLPFGAPTAGCGVGPPPNHFSQNYAPPHAAHSATTPPSREQGFPTYPSGPTGIQPGVPSNHVQAPSYTKEQIDQAWKEYTAPSGVIYYHNSISKESTYQKPDALSRKEPVGLQVAVAATPVVTTSNNAKQRKWAEYEDANTGKRYYSDGVTTTWEPPAGFIPAASENTAESEPPQKKKRIEEKKESKFNNRDEAVAAFKGLLLAKAIAPTLKWNDVVKACSSDSRWDVCENNLSLGERKQALAEYQTKRANELKTLERQERLRTKEAFGQMLTELLPSVPSFSAWNSRFADIRVALSKDDRFYAVEDEGTRENLFLDFCEEFRKRDDRKKRSRKRETQEVLLSFLKEKEEAGSLTFASTWYVDRLQQSSPEF